MLMTQVVDGAMRVGPNAATKPVEQTVRHSVRAVVWLTGRRAGD